MPFTRNACLRGDDHDLCASTPKAPAARVGPREPGAETNAKVWPSDSLDILMAPAMAIHPALIDAPSTTLIMCEQPSNSPSLAVARLEASLCPPCLCSCGGCLPPAPMLSQILACTSPRQQSSTLTPLSLTFGPESHHSPTPSQHIFAKSPF